MCANEYVYLEKLCAQMNHILLKMCANLLPPTKQSHICVVFLWAMRLRSLQNSVALINYNKSVIYVSNTRFSELYVN